MKAEHHNPLMKGGGPAFPVHWQEDDGQHVAVGGMTLRDYFAAQAMQGLVGKMADVMALGDEVLPVSMRATAVLAYGMADAMLMERGRGDQ